jgi:hypothetical protein
MGGINRRRRGRHGGAGGFPGQRSRHWGAVRKRRPLSGSVASFHGVCCNTEACCPWHVVGMRGPTTCLGKPPHTAKPTCVGKTNAAARGVSVRPVGSKGGPGARQRRLQGPITGWAAQGASASSTRLRRGQRGASARPAGQSGGADAAWKRGGERRRCQEPTPGLQAQREVGRQRQHSIAQGKGMGQLQLQGQGAGLVPPPSWDMECIKMRKVWRHSVLWRRRARAAVGGRAAPVTAAPRPAAAGSRRARFARSRVACLAPWPPSRPHVRARQAAPRGRPQAAHACAATG